MNVMRKLRGNNSATGGSPTAGAGCATANGNITSSSNAGGAHVGDEITAATDARIQISLHTLKQLFNEYTHPKEALSEHERDMKLYQMLPLFCKVPPTCVFKSYF